MLAIEGGATYYTIDVHHNITIILRRQNACMFVTNERCCRS